MKRLYTYPNKLITNNHQKFKENQPKHDIQQKSFKGITKEEQTQSQQKEGNSKDPEEK